MKTLIARALPCLVLSAACWACADDFYSAPDSATPPAPAAPTTPHTPPEYGLHKLGVRNEPWTWRNLFYGPLEILAAPVMLFMGPVAGASASYDVFTDPDDTTPMAPVRGTLGAIGGGLVGLFAAPATLCVGLFDTLTGGAFTDGYTFYDVAL
ncbi:MAG: hypothetical protein N2595_10395 [bacterium]|nr:hypothetical protein [bacterium]